MTPDFDPPPTWATLGIYAFMLTTCIVFWVVLITLIFRWLH